MHLNLNADLGESFGPWPMGDDERLLGAVDSANVACGFHAGDPVVMSDTIRTACQRRVSLGAHPGFADLQGFGRRPMTLPDRALYALVQYQLAAMDGLCRAHGTTMTHVKPHGALNNMICEDRAMATVVVDAIAHFDAGQIVLAPVLSELAAAAQGAGLAVALEVFADRAYNTNGTLVSRGEPGAVLQDTGDCIEHVLRMVEAQGLVTRDGQVLPTHFHSICVHGDNAHAVDTALQLRKVLLHAGHTLHALPELLLAAPG